MQNSFFSVLLFSLAGCGLTTHALAQDNPSSHSNKPEYADYQHWQLLSVSHRLDKKTLRAILGNATAIEASHKTPLKSWPDGSILAKMAWHETTHPNWPQAIVPAKLEKAEAMIKDSKKYADTGGWGFGYWEGKKFTLHTAEKSKECFACHTMVKDHDYVFTAPVF